MDGYLLGYVLIFIAMIVTMAAQAKVSNAYRKYSQYDSYTGMTGAMMARRMLDEYGLNHIQIREVNGQLSDYYDPRNETVHLSRDIYEGTSIASLAVACHECGHAIQHAEGYTSLVVRNTLVPYCNLSSKLGYVAIFIGLAMNSYTLAMVGILLVSAILFYQVITLPVEFNASNRALAYLNSLGLNGSTLEGSKDMLTAAALTYVAAAFSALMSILRLLLIVLGNGKRRR